MKYASNAHPAMRCRNGSSFWRRVFGFVMTAFSEVIPGMLPACAKLAIMAASGSPSEDAPGKDGSGPAAAASASRSCLIVSSGEDVSGTPPLGGRAGGGRTCWGRVRWRESLGEAAVAVGVGRSVCSPTNRSSVGRSGNDASGGSEMQMSASHRRAADVRTYRHACTPTHPRPLRRR